jgi:hypothetical protein
MSQVDRDWLKAKNPKAPALKREAEEDWARDQARNTLSDLPRRAGLRAKIDRSRPEQELAQFVRSQAGVAPNP